MNKNKIGYVIIVLLLFQGCFLPKGEFDLELNLEAQLENNVRNSNDLLETGEIIIKRLENYGISKGNINLEITGDKIYLKISEINNPKRIKGLITTQGKFEFWETYKYSEIYQYFMEANNYLSDIYYTEEEIYEDATDITLLDEITGDTNAIDNDEQKIRSYSKKNPLFAILNPAYVQRKGQYFPGQTATVGYAKIKDTAEVNKLLIESVKFFPINLKLAWMKTPNIEDSEVLELLALRYSNPDKETVLGGEVITKARQFYDQNDRIEVSIDMNNEGANIWKRMTRDNIGNQIALVLDDYVYSAPTVNSEIPSGQSSIAGNFTVEEAQDLANILETGKLPYKLIVVEEKIHKRE